MKKKKIIPVIMLLFVMILLVPSKTEAKTKRVKSISVKFNKKAKKGKKVKTNATVTVKMASKNYSIKHTHIKIEIAESNKMTVGYESKTIAARNKNTVSAKFTGYKLKKDDKLYVRVTVLNKDSGICYLGTTNVKACSFK